MPTPEKPKFDLVTQRRIHQAVQRFFSKVQGEYNISDRELVMCMLAAAWGQSRRIGMTTPQLVEWALKNWQECDAAINREAATLLQTNRHG